MKKALISKNEIINNVDGTTGFRVAEVTSTPFDVHESLYWVDCDDTIEADQYYLDSVTGLITLTPVKRSNTPAKPSGTQPISTGAQTF